MDNSIVFEVCSNTVFWKDWNFWLALATAGAAIIALWQTKKNQRQDDISQRQNTGLNLLPLRKEILDKVKKGEFNEIYWDAAILFSDAILQMIEKAGNLKSNYKEIEYKISFIEDLIKENSDEDFWRYGKLCDDSDGDPTLLEELYQLTDKYNRTTTLPGESTPSVLVFRDLHPKYKEAKRAYDSYSVVVFTKMQNEIRKSIMVDENEENKGMICKITTFFKSIKKNCGRKKIGGKWLNKSFAKILCWILPALLLLAFAFNKLGFNITYDPTIITDWNAVSGCAAWAGVATSLLAIWYAIQVPKKIADRQDKIALFEKRYDLFIEIKKHYVFSQMIAMCNETEQVFICSNTVFQFSFKDSERVSQLNHMTADLFSKVLFLFPKIQKEDYQAVVNTESSYFLQGLCNNIDEVNKRKQYVYVMSNFWKKYNSMFAEYLNI